MANKTSNREVSNTQVVPQKKTSKFVEVASEGINDVQGLGKVISATFSDLANGIIGLKPANTIARLTDVGIKTAKHLEDYGNTEFNPQDLASAEDMN